ncbi:MAG: NADH-quinone oxidoreductase subunit C [Cyclobacteriaceae bacterium]|nr:NADH-quinone oxidoreductase subunit C [Cyclobacteriaceae bacterium]
MSTFDQVLTLVKDSCTHGEVAVDENATPRAIKISAHDLVEVCQNLHRSPATYFDMLSCITGIDNGAEAGTMEVVYNLYSIPFNIHLMLKVLLSRDHPQVHTVSHIWKTADWQEREIFDMYGISILNHPDLRRILMPADWEGFPLRKDYKHQAYYRNVKVEY